MSYPLNEYLDFINIDDKKTKIFIEKEILENTNQIISKAKRSYDNNMPLVKKFLTKYNVDLNYIKSQANKIANYIKTQKKNGTPADKTAKQIIDTIGKNTIQKCIKNATSYAESKDIPLTEKIIRSLGIFTIMYLVSLIILNVGVFFFGGKMATILLVIIVAPIVEEYAKRVALLEGYPFLYTGIFAGLEAIKYIVALTAAGMPIGQAVIARALAVGLHFTTTMIQKIFHDEEIKEGREPGMAGYIAAVALHMLWNYSALAGSGLI